MNRGRKRAILLFAVLGVLSIGIAKGYGIYKEKALRYWLRPYVAWEFSERIDIRSAPKPVHVMFLIVDHFEPTTLENMRNWRSRYEILAGKHRDADGHPLRYTWFYFADGFKEDVFEEIVELSKMGLGEIELQLHHKDDTPDSFREKIRLAKKAFRRGGALVTVDGKEAFGYVAGNWALDNSRNEGGKNFSGVNSEITILKEEGCFADFTFPSVNEAQPAIVNRIYYAFDDPQKPKSYNTGIVMKRGKTGNLDKDGFVIFPGPLFINWRDWKHVYYPSIDDGQIQSGNPPKDARIEGWIRAAIHVAGKEDWIFVKAFTHGASKRNQDILFGGEMENALDTLENKYNDGNNFKLHYVTAREAYNIAKAAEEGRTGDPNDYRDHVIKPYINSSKGTLHGTRR